MIQIIGHDPILEFDHFVKILTILSRSAAVDEVVTRGAESNMSKSSVVGSGLWGRGVDIMQIYQGPSQTASTPNESTNISLLSPELIASLKYTPTE